MFFISLAAESLLKQINFFFLFHAKFNSPAAVQCPFNLSKSCVQKKPYTFTFQSVCSHAS